MTSWDRAIDVCKRLSSIFARHTRKFRHPPTTFRMKMRALLSVVLALAALALISAAPFMYAEDSDNMLDSEDLATHFDLDSDARDGDVDFDSTDGDLDEETSDTADDDEDLGGEFNCSMWASTSPISQPNVLCAVQTRFLTAPRPTQTDRKNTRTQTQTRISRRYRNYCGASACSTA